LPSLLSLRGPTPEPAPQEAVPPVRIVLAYNGLPPLRIPATVLHGPIPATPQQVPKPSVVLLAAGVVTQLGRVVVLRGPVIVEPTVYVPRLTIVMASVAPPDVATLVSGGHGLAPATVTPPVIVRWMSEKRAKWRSEQRKTWPSERRVVWRRGKGTMTKTISGFKELDQATTETKDYVCDTSEYLPSTVSVSSATATLTSPSGGTQAISPSLSNNSGGVQAIVTTRVTIAHLNSVAGAWKLDVNPTLSNGEVAPQVRFEINVPY
jgi:hypothetical protein